MTQAPLPARLVATWFGCGLSPRAPGTVGSLGAIPLHWLLSHTPPLAHGLAVTALSGLGVWAGNEVSKAAGVEDPQTVVIDEVCGTLIAMGFVASAPWPFQALALVCFRAFDIFKPGPIDTVQHLQPAGVGIMADDVLAGILAGITAYSAWALLGR